MLSHLSPKERLGYTALAAILLFFAGYVGARHLKRPAPIVVQSGAAPSAPGELIVHVTGAVRNPGVVTLAPEQRVQDAIAKAGGATEQADLEALNLAARAADGDRIHVPAKGEAASGSSVDGLVSTLPKAAGSGQGVSLSTASAQELETVPGIGPATAARILEYRAANGGFRSVDELVAIKGIGPKRLEQLRPYLRP